MNKPLKIYQKHLTTSASQYIHRKTSVTNCNTKREWNNRFTLGKLHENNNTYIYELTTSQKNNFQSKLYTSKKTFKNIHQFRIKSQPPPTRSKNQIKDKFLINIGHKLQSLWNEFYVLHTYQYSFRKYILYFPKEYHKIIIEYEIKSLEKIVNLIHTIQKNFNKRNEILGKIKNEINFYQTGNNIRKNDRIFNMINENLILFQLQSIEMFFNISKLKKEIYLGVKNGKYDLKQIKSSQKFLHIFDNDLLIKLNLELNFIKESNIGFLFNIQNNFDPFLLGIKNSNINDKIYYILLSDIIRSNINLDMNSNNYNENIFRLKKQMNQKEFIDAYNNKNTINDNTKDKLFITVNEDNLFNNLPEVNDNYIRGTSTNEEIKLNLSFEFFTDNNIINFNQKYNIEYFPKIPKQQKELFKLNKNIQDIINISLYSLMILINKDNQLYGLCVLSKSLKYANSFDIKHLSCLSDNDSEYAMFLQNLIEFIYNYFRVDHLFVHISENSLKSVLDSLEFEEVKNNECDSNNKVLLKYSKNNDHNNLSFNESENYFISIKSGIMIFHNNEEVDNKETHLNCFLIKLYNRSQNEINDFVLKLNNELQILKESNNRDKINNMLKKSQFNNDINNIELSKNKITILLYNINLSHNCLSVINIDNKNYIRIKTDIQLLYHTETNQIIYQLNLTKTLLICEINDNFKQFLYSNNNNKNPYEKLQSIYSSFKPTINIQNKIIYIPYITNEIEPKYNTNLISYDKVNIGNNSSFVNGIKYKCIQIFPTEQDIFITQPFFFAVIIINNETPSFSNKILCTYCNIFNI